MKELPLYQHIEELRKRIFLIIASILVLFLIGLYFSNTLISFIIHDLVGLNIKIVTLSPLEYIYTQIKIGLLIGIFFSLPYIFYQTLIFVNPALRRKERIGIMFILPAFVLLFVIGVVFAYYIFLRIGLFFLSQLPIPEVSNLWSVSRFMSFVFGICFSFGILFQLPLVLLVLKKLRLVNNYILKKFRKHIYVILFVVAALITPPDIVTLIILVLPLIILYEISLLIIKIF